MKRTGWEVNLSFKIEVSIVQPFFFTGGAHQRWGLQPWRQSPSTVTPSGPFSSTAGRLDFFAGRLGWKCRRLSHKLTLPKGATRVQTVFQPISSKSLKEISSSYSTLKLGWAETLYSTLSCHFFKIAGVGWGGQTWDLSVFVYFLSKEALLTTRHLFSPHTIKSFSVYPGQWLWP